MGEENLSAQTESIMVLTVDERRIIENLRQQAVIIHNGELDATFTVHHDEVKYGTITDTRPRL